MSEGRGVGEGPGSGPGEGPNPIEKTGYDPAKYKSPRAQREIAQRELGNPNEKIIERERIRREEVEYERGF
jgi:hypothetical protein